MKANTPSSRRVNLTILMAVLAVSFSAPLIKQGLNWGAPPAIIAFYRLLFSTLLLLPGVLRNRRSAAQELSALTGKDRGVLVLAGVFLALHFICWIYSLSMTSTFAATVIVCMQPLFTLIGGFMLFREKPNKASYIGIVVCIAGAVVIAVGSAASEEGNTLGDILALLGALFASAYFLCNKHLRPKLALGTHTCCVYGICAVVLFFTALFSGNALFAYPPKLYLLFAGLAVVCTLMGHSVLNWALKYAKAAYVSVALLGEPVGASVWAYFLFQEVPGTAALIGGCVIILGIVLFTLTENARTPVPDNEL